MVEVEVEGPEEEGCNSRLKGWRLRVTGAEHPHFLEDPKKSKLKRVGNKKLVGGKFFRRWKKF